MRGSVSSSRWLIQVVVRIDGLAASFLMPAVYVAWVQLFLSGSGSGI